MKLNRKSQIEITNVIFMHLIGLIGIFTFTFLFISLISSSSSRAEGLRTETLYYNYGRRLVANPDCFAYSLTSVLYTKNGLAVGYRAVPGVIDMSKLFDYNHQNCLRYDLVSGAGSADPSNPYASYPVVYYEITVNDVSSNVTFLTVRAGNNFTTNVTAYTVNSGVYLGVTSGVTYELCDNEGGICPPGCLYDCNALREYIGLPANERLDIMCEGETRDLTRITPGTNCWTEEFNDVSRIVQPYSPAIANVSVEFNCSIPTIMPGTTSESGNVFEKTLSYPVILRYPVYNRNYTDIYSSSFNDLGFIEHVGTFTVRFCVIKIPTMCDPFYRYAYKDTLLGDFFSDPVYNPEICNAGGLPQI